METYSANWGSTYADLDSGGLDSDVDFGCAGFGGDAVLHGGVRRGIRGLERLCIGTCSAVCVCVCMYVYVHEGVRKGKRGLGQLCIGMCSAVCVGVCMCLCVMVCEKANVALFYYV